MRIGYRDYVDWVVVRILGLVFHWEFSSSRTSMFSFLNIQVKYMVYKGTRLVAGARATIIFGRAGTSSHRRKYSSLNASWLLPDKSAV